MQYRSAGRCVSGKPIDITCQRYLLNQFDPCIVSTEIRQPIYNQGYAKQYLLHNEYGAHCVFLNLCDPLK